MTRILTSLLLSAAATLSLAAELLSVTPEQLSEMQAAGALVVDVRTPEEWAKTGLIPGSKGLTFFDGNGKADPAGWLRQLEPLHRRPDQPVILVCRSGNRSATVGTMLAKEAGYPKVYHLDQGLKSWQMAGKPLAPSPGCQGC